MSGERHWQSDDMTVTKVVLNEGDFAQDCGKFGQEITLILEEVENMAKLQETSNFSLVEESKLCVRVGHAFSEVDFGLEKAAMSMYPGERSRHSGLFGLCLMHGLFWLENWVF